MTPLHATCLVQHHPVISNQLTTAGKTAPPEQLRSPFTLFVPPSKGRMVDTCFGGRLHNETARFDPGPTGQTTNWGFLCQIFVLRKILAVVYNLSSFVARTPKLPPFTLAVKSFSPKADLARLSCDWRAFFITPSRTYPTMPLLGSQHTPHQIQLYGYIL